jgi:hypothetical protein
VATKIEAAVFRTSVEYRLALKVDSSRVVRAVIVFAVPFLIQQEAQAWRATGHRTIGRMAIESP